MKFSTRDRDNDGMSGWLGGSCVNDNDEFGGWWYDACTASNPTGMYLDNVNWYTVFNDWYSFKKVVMKIGPA